MSPTKLGGNVTISGDPLEADAQEAALNAASALRAQRDAELAVIEQARARVFALSAQIATAERDAYQRKISRGKR